MVWYHRILTTLYANLALSSPERSTDPENPCWSHSWQFSRKPSPNKNNSYVVLYGSFWRSGWTKWPTTSAGDPSGSSRGSDLTNLTLSRAKFLMSCWTSKSDGRCGKNMEKSEMMLKYCGETHLSPCLVFAQYTVVSSVGAHCSECQYHFNLQCPPGLS